MKKNTSGGMCEGYQRKAKEIKICVLVQCNPSLLSIASIGVFVFEIVFIMIVHRLVVDYLRFK